MALPSNGQVSLNDVRVETSQSIFPNYSLHSAFVGAGYWSIDTEVYSPINVNGCNAWNENSPIGQNNFSMSMWYNYSHTNNIALETTGTLYIHANSRTEYNCYVKTMLIVDAGTSNKKLNINVSGSDGNSIEVYYGKPWKNSGAQYTASVSQLITSSAVTPNINFSLDYDYTYDSNVGQYIYFVLIENQCF